MKESPQKTEKRTLPGGTPNPLPNRTTVPRMANRARVAIAVQSRSRKVRFCRASTRSSRCAMGRKVGMA